MNNFARLTAAFIFPHIRFLHVFAAAPSFVNLSQDDLDTIVKDLGGLHAHTSVSPASSLGKIFGVEAGVIVGAAQVPGVEALVRESDPTADASALPHAGILAAVSVPLGFKFELAFVPEREMGDVDFKYTAAALQWTMTDTLFPLPLDLAFKLHHTTAELGFTQDVRWHPC